MPKLVVRADFTAACLHCSARDDDAGARDREQVPRDIIENPPISIGDTVVGRVVWSSERGSKVALAVDNRIRG